MRDHLQPIADVRVRPAMTVRELVDAMGEGGGFTAKEVATAARILRRMRDDDASVILSFPAAMMATGCRGVLVDMVESGFVDAVVTTCGTLDHDLARTWRDYYHGDWRLDDAALHREAVNRLGNVLLPNESYGEILEEKLQPWFAEMFRERKSWSTRDLCAEMGRRIADEPRAAASLLATAARRGVPIFVPGITDGAVGSQIWLAWQKDRKIAIDLMADEHALFDFVSGAEKLGAVMLGGGISKHHTIWWSQFRDGLDYAVYVTTAPEWDGSLSGARLEEAISWGKVKEDARIVNVPGEATVLLPLLWAGVRE